MTITEMQEKWFSLKNDLISVGCGLSNEDALEILKDCDSIVSEYRLIETEVKLLKRVIYTQNARSFGGGHEAADLQKDHESAKAELAKFYKTRGSLV